MVRVGNDTDDGAPRPLVCVANAHLRSQRIRFPIDLSRRRFGDHHDRLAADGVTLVEEPAGTQLDAHDPQIVRRGAVGLYTRVICGVWLHPSAGVEPTTVEVAAEGDLPGERSRFDTRQRAHALQ